MMFLKNYISILILCCVFLFFGGMMLFQHPWSAIATCAFIIAVIVTVFMVQDERIEKLEKRIKKLENKEDSAL